jgi:3-oxoacyl-[acyl-carrier protein] reductase
MAQPWSCAPVVEPRPPAESITAETIFYRPAHRSLAQRRSPMERLSGRTTIVTGAARGIGRAIATAFAAEGASVALVDRRGEEAEEVSDSLGTKTVIALEADVSDEHAVTRAVHRVQEQWGRIDVLVNNAGIAPFKPITEMELADWRQVIEGDLTSVFLCSRAVLPGMVENESGCIINLGSQLGLIGAAQMTHYCAAKAGIFGFTKALAREVAGQGIRVNAIAPGPVDTPSVAASPREPLEKLKTEIPLLRFGRPEEIAPTAVLLASDEGTYYTGSILNVSGGHAMI